MRYIDQSIETNNQEKKNFQLKNGLQKMHFELIDEGL